MFEPARKHRSASGYSHTYEHEYWVAFRATFEIGKVCTDYCCEYLQDRNPGVGQRADWPVPVRNLNE